MNRQRGGSMKVSGYLALALLALAVGEVATIRYLFQHRSIQINFPAAVSPQKRIQTSAAPVEDDTDSDYYVTHIFPPNRTVCSFDNTICYTKI
jgi:hypothetical protein